MAKGLTAEEVVGRFTGGVSGAGSKWEERTLAGAERFAAWINTWYPRLCAMLPGVYRLRDPYERVKRVCEFTKRTARNYRAEKIRRLAGLAVPTPAAGGATPA